MPTKIGVDREDLRDLIDMAMIADGVKRCPGGRLIRDGYICLHCGEDSSHECGAPRSKNLTRRMLDDLMGALPMEG